VTLSPDSPDRYDRILHAVGSAFDGLGAWPDHPRTLETLADNVEQLVDVELEASQRRAITLQTRIDNARDWARRNVTTDQQAGLLAALRGDQL
jgi:hypothetical protein